MGFRVSDSIQNIKRKDHFLVDTARLMYGVYDFNGTTECLQGVVVELRGSSYASDY